MNPAPSQRWFHWAGTVVEEAKMGWHVGKQGQKQALFGSQGRNRFRGAGLAELLGKEMGQRAEQAPFVLCVGCSLNDSPLSPVA